MHRLPATLPLKPDILWQVPLTAASLGGVAATSELVIVSDRELNNTVDVWKCFSAIEGKPRWSVRTPAPGNLDYGNSPRATPVIASGFAYLFGAFGHLTCVNVGSGETVWEVNLKDEYEAPSEPKWGTCSTPLVIDGRVIVNPGAKAASVVALNAKTGKELWKTPGHAAGYGSFIQAGIRGKSQIIGHDAVSLGGWDPASGERLWTLLPDKPNDFNVPTPILHGEQLIVVTENNGTRLHDFDAKGRIVPKPAAVNRKLAPDTHTPVLVGQRLFGFHKRLYCLDVGHGFKEVWSADDAALTKYVALVADESRVLCITMTGELILIDAKADDYTPLGKLKMLDGETGLYSHPAFVGNRVFVRSAAGLIAAVL